MLLVASSPFVVPITRTLMEVAAAPVTSSSAKAGAEMERPRGKSTATVIPRAKLCFVHPVQPDPSRSPCAWNAQRQSARKSTVTLTIGK
ncbi:hypothetical protein B484DRAFT_446021 [Ochromonadaceae sp. CCMP2298]|nr:hypothetical protein B484DRAFT_446021 [Ochromonadaceae sp. CCMP2298]